LEKYNIVVEGLQIINFDYSQQFNAAIEEKQVAEQRTLTEQNKLERVKYEAEQKVVQAEAEAKVIQIQASAIKAQGGKEYIELKAIEKWNGVLPTYMGSGAVPFVNVGGK
jgi:regulator of protease activity HflC (stomatin/prohibitin superfamily)